jgi:hypothetical protein
MLSEGRPLGSPFRNPAMSVFEPLLAAKLTCSPYLGYEANDPRADIRTCESSITLPLLNGVHENTAERISVAWASRVASGF